MVAPPRPATIRPEIYSPGGRDVVWKRDASVAEMIRHLDEHTRKMPNWDRLTNSQKFDTLSKAEYEAVIEEFGNCAEDFSYAARNYFWITNNEGRDQLMTLWESQYLVLQKYYDLKAQGRAQKIYIVKGRQLGVSLLVEAMIGWRTMFFPNIEAIVVSVDAPHSAYLFGLMLHVYDRMPWWLKPEWASREEKNGIWFQNPDESRRSIEPGLDSHVYVQWSSQYSGVGQGHKLFAAHASELSDWHQPNVYQIIMEDLKPAIKDNAEAFEFVETTGKEAGSASHRLWKQCEKMAEEAELYPLFLPYFFEKSRQRTPIDGWTPKREEISMRERVKREWVRCMACQQYFVRAAHGRDRMGESCPSCKIGVLGIVIMTDAQLYWKDVERRKADGLGRDALQGHLREYASTAEESWQVGGLAVFGPECQEAVNRTIIDPDKSPGVKVGYIDTKRRFHGIDRNKPDPNNPGKFYCYLEQCNLDHQADYVDQHNTTIWEEPRAGFSYCVGVDIAEGLRQDYSVIFVTRMSRSGMPDEQVCVWRDNAVEPLDLAFYCVHLGLWYNEAMLAIEYNGIGKVCADHVVHTYYYPNIFEWKHPDSKAYRSTRYHWFTKSDTREKLWQTARKWIKSGSWVIRSKNFLHEMQNFQKEEDDSKSAGHVAGEHDDELFAGMISLYCVAPETRVLTNDLRWVPIGECGVGDKLISFDENIECKRGSPCLLRESEITSHKIVYEPRFRIVTDKGDVIASGHHGWATVACRPRQGKKYSWTATDRLRAGDCIVRINRPWESDNSPEAQWLAGFLDGEGCIRLPHNGLLKFGRNVGRGSLSFSQKTGVALDKALRICRQLNIDTLDRGHTGTSRDVRVIEMRVASNHSALEIVGRLRPVRLLQNARKIWIDRPFIGWHWPIDTATVLDVLPLGIGPVVSVGTTTKTLFTEGFASHNCGHEMDADERGVIHVPMIEEKIWNPRFLMICQACGAEFGADNPEEVWRCEKCYETGTLSQKFIGKRLENDIKPDGRELWDKLDGGLVDTEDPFNRPLRWDQL